MKSPPLFLAPSEMKPGKYFVFHDKKDQNGNVETIETTVHVTTKLEVINHYPQVLKLDAGLRKQIVTYHLNNQQ